jgi:hypothetical protein
LFQTVGQLDSEKHVPGKPYHMIQPSLKESVLTLTMSYVEGLEGEPKLKLFIYVDDSYLFKTETYESSSSTNINIAIDM